MAMRKIVHIDEEKCDGCGLCVPSCEEGAIRIIEGKARLLSDVYCDGLGACLGHCPQDAITVIEREADAFDEEAVERHLSGLETITPAPKPALPVMSSVGQCPGSAARQLKKAEPKPEVNQAATAPQASGLMNWPVQLHLVPPNAPYLANADLLLAADCVPFACPDFHARFLDGRPLLIGCPKLDDGRSYVQKLAQIIQHARLKKITVLRMEVPCCMGLVQIAQAAAQVAGEDVPVEEVVISIQGQVLPHTQPANCAG